MNIVTNVTLTLQTDCGDGQLNPSGMLYASKPNTEHSQLRDALVWLEDAKAEGSAINHLMQLGYDAENIAFIPFSSKENWLKAYPFIVPSLECDGQGTISAFRLGAAPVADAVGSSTLALTSSPPKTKSKRSASSPKSRKRKRGGPRVYKLAILTNDLRDELHIQIYKYFHWLLDKLIENEMTFHGRTLLSDSKLSALGVQSIISTLESSLPIVKTLSASNMVVSDEIIPLLEKSMEDELGALADERLVKTEAEPYQHQWYDFDEMFNKLVEFKRKNGHCNIPNRYKEDRRLGKWVSKLREKRGELDKKEEEYETSNSRGKVTSRTLTKERIEQLDEIGFTWRIKTKPPVPWDTRLRELVEFYQTNGSWPSRKHDGTLGAWVHNQRQMYGRKDKHFMAERFAKLDEIGEYYVMSLLSLVHELLVC
jgi:hypothetical protein